MKRLMSQNPRSSSSEIIDSSELPQSREDRNAWTGEKGKGVSIDQVKAAALRADREAKAKIDERMREIAIESLKDDGGLLPDYDDTLS